MQHATLQRQVVLVTGASTGIGRELALGLARRGATVAGLARGRERLETAMREIGEETGAPTLAVTTDVSDRAGVESAVSQVRNQFGDVDLLINNAGLIDAAEVPVWEADPDQWWDVVSSHIQGALLTIHALVPRMVERGRGRVVNLASGMGTRPVPHYSAYTVAKAGQIRLTETLAASLEGTGVTAFNIAPGLVETEMTRSMPMWDGHTSWTPPERVVELVCAAATGELDQWSGRFLRAGGDDPATVGELSPAGGDRQLRLRTYGPEDPMA